MTSAYDRWKTDPPEQPGLEECECASCGGWIVDDALDGLRSELEDCETPEDEEAVLANATCESCRRKEEGS